MNLKLKIHCITALSAAILGAASALPVYAASASHLSVPSASALSETSAATVRVDRAASHSGSALSPVDYVSTLVGTMSKREFSTGNTYPAVARPWGMNFWTPMTGVMGDGWTYSYTADKINGFKQTHQPSPWMNDYGQFVIMPATVSSDFEADKRASWFSHKAETATPYYYSVYLADHDVFTEMTATERAAAFRITYPEKELSYLIVDAFDTGSYIKVIPEENKIIGFTTKNCGGVPLNFKNWFVVSSDTPFEYVSTVTDGGKVSSETEAVSFHSGAVVGFRTVRGQKVNLKVASSFISLEQAELNLAELGDGDFDRIKREGKDRWNEVLGRIKVEDNDIDRLRTFWSCLYRALLFPRDLSEVDADGRRMHYSPYNGDVLPGYMFADTGFWDTFRSLFPLLNLVYPDQNVKIQEGLVNDYLESGFLPEWASPGHRPCMVGNNSASVVADAYIKGLRGYDIEKLWEAVVRDANSVHPTVSSSGRLGWQYYNELGYVPCDVGINESAARTLEYAYDDWCIWQLGLALGKPEKEIAVYRDRALNYRNLYLASESLMCGRKADGSFNLPLNPYKWGGDFTEGNALQYTWSVFHDPYGLMSLMGGEDAFNAALDNVFNMPPIFDDSYYGSTIHEIREMQVMNMGNYAHGNQPIQHMLYLYDWGGQPWKAQSRIREVMDKFYTSAPDGYCGDEDNGQTSAWYVFSALGFYPVCPATDQYDIGTTLFRKVTISLPSGKELVIEAPGNSRENCYISSMTVNGKPYSKMYFTHGQLTGGSHIVFKMSPEPNKSLGEKVSDRPYSMSGKPVEIKMKDQGIDRSAWIYVPSGVAGSNTVADAAVAAGSRTVADAAAGRAAGSSTVADAAAGRAAGSHAVATDSKTVKKNGKGGMPLVVVLHGYGGTAMRDGLRFKELADRYGFAVCWPQGAKDGTGHNCWNVGYPFQSDYSIDDTKFLRNLIGLLSRDYGVNPDNVFLTGMSNGGEMCYKMAAEHPETFSAIASIAGLTLNSMSVNYSKPVPFMEVHGTDDKVSNWDGDPENRGGWGAYLSVPAAVGHIIAANHAVEVGEESVPSKSKEVILHTYKGGLPAWKGGPSADVLLYEVIGGDHSWSEHSLDTCALVWDFFSRYLR